MSTSAMKKIGKAALYAVKEQLKEDFFPLSKDFRWIEDADNNLHLIYNNLEVAKVEGKILTMYMNCEARFVIEKELSIWQLSSRIAKWISRNTNPTEKLRNLKLINYNMIVDETATAEEPMNLPDGYSWYRREDNTCYLSDAEGTKICIYNIDSGIYNYDDEGWEEIHHKSEKGLRNYIERRERKYIMEA